MSLVREIQVVVVLTNDCLSIVKTDKVNHTVKTDIVRLVVEIKSFGMSADEYDKETGPYDGLQTKIKLYMMNRQHGRMILESVENSPLIWPLIKENGVTRPKKYFELSAMEEIQAYCDVKATNIILQGLPPDVYALVSNHKVAKELWE
nr:hypothetical protein [Tanacetum cinerariifolium]